LTFLCLVNHFEALNLIVVLLDHSVTLRRQSNDQLSILCESIAQSEVEDEICLLSYNVAEISLS
jgi:hypothetical protein